MSGSTKAGKNAKVEVVVKSQQTRGRRNRRNRNKRQRSNSASSKRRVGYAKAAQAVRMSRQLAAPSRTMVTQIAAAIALPNEHPYVRIPSTNIARTAVMTTRQIGTITSPTVASGDFNSGDILIALFGQPGRAYMAYGAFGSAPATYKLRFGMFSTLSENWVWNPNTALQASAAKMEIETDWPLCSGYSLTTGAVHGPLIAAATSGGKRFLYMRPSDELWMVCGGTTASGAWGFDGKINVWQEGRLGAFEIVSWAMSGSGALPTYAKIFDSITVPCWVSVTVEAVTSTASPVQAGAYFNFELRTMGAQGTTAGEWTLRPYNDFVAASSGDPAMAERVKVNAASLLLTNASAEMYAQGVLVAARIRGTNPHLVTASSLGASADLYRGKAAHGVYTFMENTERSNEFRQCRGFSTGDCLVYDLDELDYFHFIQATNNGVSPNTALQATNVYAVTADASFEFEADTRRYARRVAAGNLDDLYAARKLLGARPEWFYENPLHLSDIYGFVKRAARAAVNTAGRYAPYAATAASAIDPTGAAGYHALATLLGRMTT